MILLGLAKAFQKRRFAEALAIIRKAKEAAPDRVPDYWHSAAWVAHVERMAARTRPLPSRPTGNIRPNDPMESLDLALICSDQKRFVASARYWAWALEADPSLGDDRRFQYWFSAACTAVMAASSKGQMKRRQTSHPRPTYGARLSGGSSPTWRSGPVRGFRLASGSRSGTPGDATMAEGYRPSRRPRCGGSRPSVRCRAE